MDKLRMVGGTPLKGEVVIAGAKTERLNGSQGSRGEGSTPAGIEAHPTNKQVALNKTKRFNLPTHNIILLGSFLDRCQLLCYTKTD
jgi:hypothetical protein